MIVVSTKHVRVHRFDIFASRKRCSTRVNTINLLQIVIRDTLRVACRQKHVQALVPYGFGIAGRLKRVLSVLIIDTSSRKALTTTSTRAASLSDLLECDWMYVATRLPASSYSSMSSCDSDMLLMLPVDRGSKCG